MMQYYPTIQRKIYQQIVARCICEKDYELNDFFEAKTDDSVLAIVEWVDTYTVYCANEKRNEKFKQITLEQEILITHFEKSENKNDFLTATEIMLAMSNALGVRMNNVKIGKALTALNFERIKHSKKQIYGYLIKRKIEDEKNE
jgi:hypothetical protein